MNSIKSNIMQFWEGIKIPCASSAFDFVVYLIIQYLVMFQIFSSCFALCFHPWIPLDKSEKGVISAADCSKVGKELD